ncbi:helix-turn-helix transcriptional regulator [Halomonas sp. I1]|uniref:helix-turn-helix transcriptional regulator n=1 Tax=Halomonas sp. I1 TaxID=393536 RepID=UPI0028DFDC35|nr:helix-turn-helix transcriptional regulator [Halomonas sp. I1]MDT8895679.1 helix-turn-helix transcriptional regulator [Halomonas sp. I1]
MSIDVPAEPLAARITRLRNEAGLTKVELARKVGVSDVAVAYWESAAISHIGHHNLMKLALVFDVTVSELLDDPLLRRRDAQVASHALANHAKKVAREEAKRTSSGGE